jgi:fibronectin-binding autotransporter adhesin
MMSFLRAKLRSGLFAALVLGTLVLVIGKSGAQNGTWDPTKNGGNYSWSSQNNWVGNTVANGAGNTADFTQVSMTSAINLNVNGNRTIGQLIFGNTGLGAGNFDWTLSGGGSNSLVLDNGASAPVINTQVASQTVTIDTSLQGTNGFNKLGPGNLVLTDATNGITGDIQVAAGQLLVNGTILSGAGTVFAGLTSLNTGGTLGGIGTINRGVTVRNIGGSQLTGGALGATGNLAITGNLLLDRTGGAGGAYAWDMGAAGLGFLVPPAIPGVSGGISDKVNVTGNVTLTNAEVRINGLIGNGFNNTLYYSWQIGSATGTVTGLATATVNPGNLNPAPNGTFTLAQSGTGLYLNYAPVPEPTAVLAVAGLGVAGLGAYRRRRAAKA